MTAKKKTVAEIAQLLAEIEKFKTTGAMFVFTPNPRQRDFLDAGKNFRERLLKAGNQNGKTMTAAFEVACHMTGLYPTWWKGYRFLKPPRVWVVGVSSIMARDGAQKLLLGEPEALGTGMVPREKIIGKPTASRSATDAVDTFTVEHISGGRSTATFKSCEQGREKFQSEKVDLIWLDEEPPLDIYTECLTRTTVSRGIVMLTFTPLGGVTPVVQRFLKEKPAGTVVISMTIHDAEHIPKEEREAMMLRWPVHERKARALGEPYLGSNAVFEEVDPDTLRVPLTLRGGVVYHKDHGELDTSTWGKLWALDFGISHPFAAVLLAWDKEYDVVYVLEALRIGGTGKNSSIPKVHAERMKAIASGVPVAWPHDGHARDKGSGEQLSKFYKKEGLNMMMTHATFPDGGYSTEAGVREMLVRMRSERFKVAAHLADWFEEFGSYYRKDGLIVKEGDDLLSATRIGVMQIRSAKPVALGNRPGTAPRRPGATMAKDVDFDPF